MRVAMWSGPRNLSTAMMYAFGNRSDCAVVDEPFYASYLKLSGIQHPLRDAILASQSNDPEVVAASLIGPIPDGKTNFYQKHMTHHMVPGVPRDWMQEVANVFLIRHPARVIASYAIKRENPTLNDIGFRQQADLFDDVQAAHGKAVVIDCHDIREDPKGMLHKLCDAVGVEFEPAMLSWPKGGHKDDGAWAKHWYGAVWNSTGFSGVEGMLPEVPGDLQDVLKAAMTHYEKLKEFKL